MKELENIVKISHKYKNKKFQTLIGRTLVGLTITTPLMLSPFFLLLNPVVAVAGFSASFLYAMVSFIMSNSENNYKTGPIERFYSSDYWKHQMNKSIVKEIYKNEEMIIKKLKEGLSNQELVALQAFLLLNEDIISKALIGLTVQADIKQKDVEYKSGVGLIISNSYEKQEFFDKAPEFKFFNIKKAIEESLKKINNEELAKLRRNYIEENYDNIYLNLKTLGGATTRNINFIIECQGYGKLKDIDYEDLGISMKGGTLSQLENIKALSEKGRVFVDWTRIKKLIKDNYKNIDGNYNSWSKEVDKLIEKQSGVVNNENILANINKKNPINKDRDKSIDAGVVKLVEIPELLQYSPQLYKDLWKQLVNNYKNIAVNESLETTDILNFNEKLEATVPNLINADNYLGKLVSPTPQSEKIKTELENNLMELIKVGDIVLAHGESNMLKALSIDKKYLKMSK